MKPTDPQYVNTTPTSRQIRRARWTLKNHERNLAKAPPELRPALAEWQGRAAALLVYRRLVPQKSRA